jgi:hypothetical protein
MRHAGKRVTKTEWNNAGGLANSRCYRLADSRGVWRYYIIPEA